MPRLVVPDVTRFAMIGHWLDGTPIINTVDEAWTSDGGIGGREGNIEAIAEDVRNAWQDHVVPVLCSAYTFDRVDYVDIDNANGVVGTMGATNTRPVVGGVDAAPAPPDHCIMVDKLTTRTRGARRGRWFLSGVDETRVDQMGIIIPSYLAGIQSAMDDWLDSVSDTSDLQLDRAPVVISDKLQVGNRIRQMVARPKIGLQRRRIGK